MKSEVLDEITIEKVNYPPVIRRFQSLFVDQVLLISFMFIISSLFGSSEEDSNGALRGILFLSLILIYEPFCLSFGTTLGNKVAGIRVRKFNEEEKKLSLENSYIRFIVKLILGVISFFTVTSNKSKRAIHDFASGSIVIYVKNKLK